MSAKPDEPINSLMSLAVLLSSQASWAPAVRKQAVALVNETMHALDTAKSERAQFRALLAEWEDGMYDGPDFLRRVRLALHIGKPTVSLASLRGIARKP